jgi:kynureninase
MLSIVDQVNKLGSGPLTELTIEEHLRPLFSRVLKRNEIYLANHSLGRPLDQTEKDIEEALGLWYSKMDGAWGPGGWLDEMNAFRERVARLIDLADATCVIPKTSAGQGLRAVLNSFRVDTPIRVVATSGEFDSIDFILKVYAQKGRVQVAWVEPSMSNPVPLFDSESIISAITHDTDLVVISQVVFATGQVIPNLDEIVDAAHGSGALVLIDAYHSAGVIPIRMNCDFMIGGSYKYIRGGPGACWLAIHPKHIEEKRRTLDTGWFAKADRFAFLREEDPTFAFSGDSWLESTPPILTYYQARAGMELLLAIGVERMRDYNLRQLNYLRSCFCDAGVPCFEPQSPKDFGAFALLPNSDASGLVRSLREAGVNTDARGGCVRFGPDILNTNEELREAARITAQLI